MQLHVNKQSRWAWREPTSSNCKFGRRIDQSKISLFSQPEDTESEKRMVIDSLQKQHLVHPSFITRKVKKVCEFDCCQQMPRRVLADILRFSGYRIIRNVDDKERWKDYSPDRLLVFTLLASNSLYFVRAVISLFPFWCSEPKWQTTVDWSWRIISHILFHAEMSREKANVDSAWRMIFW